MWSLLQSIDKRLPLMTFFKSQLKDYRVPFNLNIWYFFGSLALLLLLNQFATGLWLTMFYTPTAKEAFDSVEFIMRDVNGGWWLRYMHSTGASLFFIVLYLHLFRALLYGSYQAPREMVWLMGMFLFVLLMAEAFFGYLLPWGQMSYWGAQVITSLFSAIPWVGDSLVIWIRGDYYVSDATLHRFFALHVIALPLILLLIVVLHLVALRQMGSNNPEGVKVRTIPFHPYYTIKDFLGALIFLMIFFAIVFFKPDMGGYFLEPDNFVKANAMVTPDHIVPAWYMGPFYTILRAVPNKEWGIVAMISAIALFFCLPWLDKSPVRSMRYKGYGSRIGLITFVMAFLTLGYLGTISVTPFTLYVSRIVALLYFAYFIFMPFYTRKEAHQHPIGLSS